jgi:hypothetical protein
MDFHQIVSQLRNDAPLITAIGAEKSVPDIPGLYSIFVDDPDNLPPPFKEYLKRKKTRMIYLGKATKSLQVRLVEQDLRHMRASTFFRGIGAVLGFRPPKGSLIGKKNQNNYRFSNEDTEGIIKWINNHLSIRWTELTVGSIEENESTAINTLRPLLNTAHNPEALPELAALRDQCRTIALSRH